LVNPTYLPLRTMFDEEVGSYLSRILNQQDLVPIGMTFLGRVSHWIVSHKVAHRTHRDPARRQRRCETP
jgi:hypothetical protein